MLKANTDRSQASLKIVLTFLSKALWEFWNTAFPVLGKAAVDTTAFIARMLAKFAHIKTKEWIDAITFFTQMPPYLIFWSIVGFLAILLSVSGTITGAKLAWGILNV